MNIIIDGPDGVGKTTLVKKLKEHYNIDSIRLSYKDPKNYDFYSTLLKKTDCIFDRQFLSEIIYPNIFDRKCQLTFVEVCKLIAICKTKKIKIFILDTDIDVIKDRLDKRGNEHQNILDNIEYLQKEFKKVSETYNIEIIDTTQISFEDIIKKVDEYNEEH